MWLMKIAIIGSGGAGMSAAWLLDGHHQITVFERNAELGGHAHSVAIEHDGGTYFADDGFSWFSDALYPCFLRLLELNGVPTRIVPMSATFTQTRRARTFLLPPAGVRPLLRTVLNLPLLADLLQINRAINAAVPLVEAHDRALSWGEFLRRQRYSESFCREVLTPMVAGAWGGPYERVAEFSAYTLMKYFVFHRPSGLAEYPWHVIEGGAASYIERVARALPDVTFRTNARIATLARADSGGWNVIERDGRSESFDHVIVATGARDARTILADVSGLDETRRVLERFEYYAARVATHGDPSFMPPRREDWRVANVCWDGERSSLNIWVGRDRWHDLFTSYIGARVPDRCHHVSTFHLPLITPAFHAAQEDLGRLQGRDHLWFAGDWTRDIGCHEDAVVSAMRVCEALDPSSARLAALRSPRPLPAGDSPQSGRASPALAA
jgi:predicted NAD/FAD-binding protein